MAGGAVSSTLDVGAVVTVVVGGGFAVVVGFAVVGADVVGGAVVLATVAGATVESPEVAGSASSTSCTDAEVDGEVVVGATCRRVAGGRHRLALTARVVTTGDDDHSKGDQRDEDRGNDATPLGR